MQTERPVLKNAQEFIEVLRQGKELHSVADMHRSLPNLMIGGRPDTKAMKVLGEELATGTPSVREGIIDTLNRIRQLADPVYELRTPEVIALLAGPALAEADNARSKAMDLLYKYASTATLSRYGDAFTKALKEAPSGGTLILVAKAKPKGAREEVARLSRLPEWNRFSGSSKHAMRIARAALGDTKIEDEFLAEAIRAEKAGSGKGLGDALYSLAQIGTPRSLQAVCQRMRTPLIIDHFPISKISVRLLVMDALRYAFPERPELNSYGVTKDEDYIKVEQFCTQKLGVSFAGIPRPPFFTSEVYDVGH